MNIKQGKKLTVVLTLSVAALAVLTLALSIQSARAQGNIYVDKQLGRSDPVVYVGEYLTFTILIRNDTPFTITTLPLSDTYNAAVLGYVDAAPVLPDSTGADWLHWDDLTTAFGDLPPGQQIVVEVGFIAEHPETAVVNYAEVHDALGSSGALSDTNSVITGTEAVGGSSPVYKELLPGLIPQIGLPLTFTIVITNDGYTTMTTVALVDTFDPALLQFNYAVPPPDAVDAVNGILTWLNVLAGTGGLPAHDTVSVTTVFTALAAIDSTVNRAEVVSARDWYENDLGGGSDRVPITIIEGPAATETPAPTATPAAMQPAPTSVSETATPAPTATTVTTATTATTATMPIPVFLPESGQPAGITNGGLLAALLVSSMGVAALGLIRRNRTDKFKHS